MADIIYQGENGQIFADNLILTNKNGDGELTIRPASSGGAWLAKGFRQEYETLTGDRFLNLNDSGKTLTNQGAGATVTVTLPNPSGAGINYNFVRIASQAFRIDPSADDAIIYSNGQMNNGEYLELASDGAKLSIASDNNNNWVATTEFGTLTEETP